MALFGPTFDQGIAAAAVGAINVILLWLVFRRLGVNPQSQRWLLVAFALGSVHWWAAGEGTVWLFAHITAVMFALAALVLALSDDGRSWSGCSSGWVRRPACRSASRIPLYAALLGRWPVRWPPQLSGKSVLPLIRSPPGSRSRSW